MLIDFAFKNIRSFKDEAIFSIEVGEGVSDYIEENTFLSGDIEVVKSSFIFGGNASGKSNVIRAFQLPFQLLRDIKVLYFMKAADFHIKDIKIQESFKPIQENNQNLESRLLLQFEYECKDGRSFTIDYEAESISTRILLFLSMMILDNHHNSKLFLIDDFDCFLHPKLVNILLRIFNEWNDTGTQLIAITHNTNILDALVRTDQVWFVDKSYYGVSTLDNVFDYNELSIKDIKKNYQDGLYGSTQIINDSMIKDILLC